MSTQRRFRKRSRAVTAAMAAGALLAPAGAMASTAAVTQAPPPAALTAAGHSILAGPRSAAERLAGDLGISVGQAQVLLDSTYR